MRRELLEKLEGMDRRRCALLDEVETLDPERLSTRPLPGKWSILEIIEHLVVAESEILENLPDPSHLTERTRNLKSRFTYPIVMFVLRYRIPVKVPSRRMIPHGKTSLVALRHRWDESQGWFKSYIESLQEADFARTIFQHPVAGPLNVVQTVRMGELHLEIHARQIKKLLRPTS